MSEQVAREKTFEIVVGFDFSELSERAVDAALTLASQHVKAELHVVTVADLAGSLVCLPGEPRAIPDEEAQDRVRLRVAHLIGDYVARSGPVAIEPPDMVNGQKVPAIEPPLPPGAPHLRPFEHRRTYHYVDKVAHWTNRTLPVS